MRSKLILLDIDGTLLDAKYRCNDPTLKATVDSLQSRGVTFCLNSNRALEDLLPVAKNIGIKGPIVGENGVFVYYPGSDKFDYLLSQDKLTELANDKRETETALFRVLEETFPKDRIYWQDADTVSAASQDDADIYDDGAIVALNNKFRKYTVSTHLKKRRGDKLTPLSESLPQVVAALSGRFRNRNVTISSSSLFANILIYSKLTSKRKAVETLIDWKFTGAELFVVGDEMGDYEMSSGIGTFLCVANAPADVQRKATKVSTLSHAQGVSELLKSIPG